MAGCWSQFSYSLYNGESVQGSLENMRESRGYESNLECDLHKASDRQSKSRNRANETEKENVERRATDRQCNTKRRANETEQKTVEHRASEKQV